MGFSLIVDVFTRTTASTTKNATVKTVARTAAPQDSGELSSASFWLNWRALSVSSA